MYYQFSKYSGCGNDFILFDNRHLTIPTLQPDIVSRLCHRQQGVGADGVILLENSDIAHYKMRIFNPDGSEAEMCGNGIRCLLKFIQDCGIEGTKFNIETMLRVLNVGFEGEEIAVEMGEPKDIRWSIPLSPWMAHHLDTGVPHAVIFCENIDGLNLNECGKEIRRHSLFAPRGANANFAYVDANGLVHLRTYERGVELETLACGTGATATALAAAKMYGLKAPVHVTVRSGDTLKVDFKYINERFTDVRLKGPAQHIFSGTIAINDAKQFIHHRDKRKGKG